MTAKILKFVVDFNIVRTSTQVVPKPNKQNILC